ARPSCVCSFWALVFSSSVDFTFLTSLGSLPAWCGRQGYIVSLPTRRCSAAAATVDFSASRRMATICSSVNRLFLIGSSFAKKSHLSRIQWAEELGQVRVPVADPLWQGPVCPHRDWRASARRPFRNARASRSIGGRGAPGGFRRARGYTVWPWSIPPTCPAMRALHGRAAPVRRLSLVLDGCCR